MEKTMEKSIDSIFEKWTEGICPGGQVRIRKDGDIIYSKNFGYANLEHKVPVQDNTVFHVASVSKQITVMCVLLLVEEGKLKIDDDIRKYIPELIHFEEPVTIRNMMNNVSGIRDQWELLMLAGIRIKDTITQEDALSMISKQKTLNFEPLSQFLYSNSNFTLLAEIIERLSGKSMNEFAKERIFKPLGMNQTEFKDAHWKIIENRADSYADSGTGKLVHTVLNYGTYGATSLNTTANDFLKWMTNYKQPTICTEKTLETMFEAPKLKDGNDSTYAGGLFVGERKGHRYIEHGGADASYRSQIIRFIEEDLDIIVLSNTTTINVNQAAFKIADLILELENQKQEKNNKEKTNSDYYNEKIDIDTIPGFYLADINGYNFTFNIDMKDDELFEEGPYGNIPLIHQSGNCFKYQNFNLYFGKKCVLIINDKSFTLKKLEPYKVKTNCLYEGNYISEELGTTYTMIKENDLLYLKTNRNGKSLMYQLNEDELINQKGATIIKLMMKENEVTGFTLSGGRVKSIVFSKVK